ncbi:MAG: hypothetical protein GY856_27650 [bacterium]|nr:hypothetical protein [bacterium]
MARARSFALFALAAGVVLLLAAVPLSALEPAGVRVYAHTLKHQSTGDVLLLVRPYLSARGTVEEQPAAKTLVIRDTPTVVARIIPLLEALDHPPWDLRFDIQVVRAGPKRTLVSPPDSEPWSSDADLPEELVARLRGLLRYDDYRVLAKAGVTSKEGEEVTYSLGQDYSVSFRLGAVMAGQRLKLEGFRILKKVRNPANKGRWLEPREMFHATLNLWMDRPFTLVLAQGGSGREALMVAITCRRESDQP